MMGGPHQIREAFDVAKNFLTPVLDRGMHARDVYLHLGL
jgi:hypothetical protein